MKPLRLVLVTAVAALSLSPVALASTTGTASQQAAHEVSSLRHGIQWHRSMTWHYQDIAGVARTRSVHAERRTRSVPFLRWIDQRWSHRQIAAHRLAQRARHRAPGGSGRPAHYQGWLCIHSREGAWNDNTGNGYYGGLQMTSGWGGVARPDLLSPLAQMWLAERGYQASGYSHVWLSGQWPRTYPPCAGYF